jgi:NAD(P)-dependent dehydrogenase (short-subunit alcohol dehydrogenase family)
LATNFSAVCSQTCKTNQGRKARWQRFWKEKWRWLPGQAEALDKFGRIDILVNNAGILRDRMVFNMSDEEWDIVQKVHLYGHFYCARAACRHMRAQKWGRIINTSSSAGLAETFGQANYGAAKEGIIGLTRQISRDMAKYNVTCNAIRPGAATRLTLTPELKSGLGKGRENGHHCADGVKPA